MSKPQPLVIRDDVSFVDQSATGLELPGRNYEDLISDEWSNIHDRQINLSRYSSFRRILLRTVGPFTSE